MFLKNGVLDSLKGLIKDVGGISYIVVVSRCFKIQNILAYITMVGDILVIGVLLLIFLMLGLNSREPPNWIVVYLLVYAVFILGHIITLLIIERKSRELCVR